MSRVVKGIFLGSGLLLLSLLLHLGLSWKVGERLAFEPRDEQIDKSIVEIDLTVGAAQPEEEPALNFEASVELSPPEILMHSNALEMPPVSENLAHNAAAGGAALAHGRLPAVITAPLTGGAGRAGFGDQVGSGLGKSTHQFAAYVASLRETGLDVMFVVDVTGSMDWVVDEVNQRIVDIVDTVRSLVPIARFGVVAYRDFDDAEFVTRIQPLTFSLGKLSRFLNALEARGGGSWQEAISAALNRATKDAGWRVGARKVVILIGDAPPHEENFDKILGIARAMVQQGGQVSSLDVSHDSNPSLLEASLGRPVNRALYRNKPMLHFQAIADAGGGIAATMDGDIQIARQLLNLIMGGQFSTEMGLLLEGL